VVDVVSSNGSRRERFVPRPAIELSKSVNDRLAISRG